MREKHLSVALRTHPDWESNHNADVCPGWESDCSLFGAQDETQPPELPRRGSQCDALKIGLRIFKSLWFKILQK